MSQGLPIIIGRPGDPVPTVSVLVKSYNHASYIRQTIESVLTQSFQDFEIVVTDDASTDATADIVRSYRDPRIKLEISPVNLGISGAMNATIARARGRYLAILNSDDWALPDRLKQQVSFLDSHDDVALVFGLPRIVGEHNEPATAYNDFARPLQFRDMSRHTWLRDFFVNVNALSAPTAMIRRHAYKTVGPYDRRLTNLQDFDMWTRMLIAGFNIHLLPEEVTAVRIRANNANMSAPDPDRNNRTSYELVKVLRHYATMDARLLENVFGPLLHLPRTDGRPAALRLAELALRDGRPEYDIFAVDLIYEHATEQADFDWLRELTASRDTRGVRRIAELLDAVAALKGT
jgi:glycosyltransferase involved in cell wall biosynthesis